MISTKEAAELMQLSQQRVRTLLRQRKIAGQKVGRSWVVDKKSLKSFLNLPENHVNPPDKKRRSKHTPDIIALSFFTGAMGLDIGLEKSGIEILLASEIDRSCRKTIVANRPEIGLIGDIWEHSGAEIREAAGLSPNSKIDVIVGGPPCQTFSTAGARRGLKDARGNVIMRYLDVIEELQPEYAVIENVRGLLSVALSHRPHSQRNKNQPLTLEEKPGGALLVIIDRLREMGYGVSFNLYNSANFGSPQIRERVVILCHRGGEELPYLVPTHSDNPKFGLPKWRSFKDAVAGLDNVQHQHIEFPEKRLRYYKMLKPGQYWKHLPLELQKEALGKSFYAGGGKTGFLRRLDWNKPSPTLVTHPAMPATDLAHPEENRPLSIQEYKRIQEFPDDWIFCGTLLEQYKQIGNAVPVSLGKAIGDLILSHRNKKPIKYFENFKYSRYKNTDSTSWEKRHRVIHNSVNLELFEF